MVLWTLEQSRDNVWVERTLMLGIVPLLQHLNTCMSLLQLNQLFLCYSAIKQLALTMTVPVAVAVACLRCDYQCVGMLTDLFSHLAAVGA